MVNFHQLYESYAVDVYRFTYWLAGDSSEAEDITSETFVRAWVKHSTIRTETLKAYLFTIARNIYLEGKRKTPPQISLEDFYPDPAPSPELLVESLFEINSIRRFLQTLPEVDRTAFIMRVQHELPYAEIARTLNISLSAAKVKVHRVRKKLITISIEQEEVLA
ncbi:MAG: RNA polymerase sigma factor [Anaerolineales bacterium]|nr:RNA polymerase sigma factor [Anaerolineales bacterium]